MDANIRKSNRAVELVRKYEHEQGRKVKSALKKSGYDLESNYKGHKRKIEVKGTAKPNLSIPDLTETEFNRRGRLKATHLYIVVNVDGKKPELYIITRGQLARAGKITKLVKWRIPTKVQRKLESEIKLKRLG